MWWSLAILVIYLLIDSYLIYKKDINRKTAKEWDSWSIFIYSSSRMHKDERRFYSIPVIISKWIILPFFWNVMVNAFSF